MTPVTQVAPPKAPFLQWLVGIPLLYVLLTLSALLIGATAAAGLRASGHPVSAALQAVRNDESQLIEGIPLTHPVRLGVRGLDWVGDWAHRNALAINKMLSNNYLNDVANTAYIITRRGLMAFGLLAPMLIVFAAALQDGLAQRELRKYGGDPESSFVYHTAKSSIGTWIGLIVAAYLLFPAALHPHAVLCVLSPICALGITITVTRFKKYL